MQAVIFPGNPVIFATHDDAQDLTGVYPAVDVDTFHRDAPEVVTFPPGQRFAVDELGRLLDPRQVPPPEAT